MAAVNPNIAKIGTRSMQVCEALVDRQCRDARCRKGDVCRTGTILCDRPAKTAADRDVSGPGSVDHKGGVASKKTAAQYSVLRDHQCTVQYPKPRTQILLSRVDGN